MNQRFCGLLMVACAWLMTTVASANVPPAPRPATPEPAKEVHAEQIKIPVQIKHADLSGEGDGVQAKLVLPARLRDLPPPAGAPANKVGSQDTPSRNSLIAALALSLAAVSVVLVVRGKKLNGATKAAIVGVAVLAGVYGVAQANAPPRPRPAPVKAQIVVEFSADATEAVLTLPAK